MKRNRYVLIIKSYLIGYSASLIFILFLLFLDSSNFRITHFGRKVNLFELILEYLLWSLPIIIVFGGINAFLHSLFYIVLEEKIKDSLILSVMLGAILHIPSLYVGYKFKYMLLFFFISSILSSVFLFFKAVSLDD